MLGKMLKKKFWLFSSYIEFMERSSELNDLANYPQLMERSKKIGYEISKMVYRGYHAHPELQLIHDSSIQTRTRLKLAVCIKIAIFKLIVSVIFMYMHSIL